MVPLQRVTVRMRECRKSDVLVQADRRRHHTMLLQAAAKRRRLSHGKQCIAGLPPWVSFLAPEWFTPEDTGVRQQVYLVTLSALLENAATETSNATAPRDVQSLTRRFDIRVILQLFMQREFPHISTRVHTPYDVRGPNTLQN